MDREQPNHPALPRKTPERKKSVPTPDKLAASGPWLPVPYDKVHVAALQALSRGEADKRMQLLALDWIIKGACGTYDMPYRPGGEEGRRDTDFALGRMFAGQQIVKLLRVNLAMLPNDDPRADPPEPRE